MEENNRFQMDVKLLHRALKRKSRKKHPYTTVEKTIQTVSNHQTGAGVSAVAFKGYFIEAASDASAYTIPRFIYEL